MYVLLWITGRRDWSMFVCLSVNLLISLFFSLYICLFVCPLYVSLLVCPYVCLSICLCVRPSVVRMFAYLSYIYKFIYLLSDDHMIYLNLHFLMHFWHYYIFDRFKIMLLGGKKRNILEKLRFKICWVETYQLRIVKLKFLTDISVKELIEFFKGWKK